MSRAVCTLYESSNHWHSQVITLSGSVDRQVDGYPKAPFLLICETASIVFNNGRLRYLKVCQLGAIK